MYRTLAVLALVVLSLPIVAQEMANEDPPPLPVDVLEVAPGEPAAVVVPVPDQATEEEARAVGVSSAETLQQVASGEVTVEEATRDKAESPDGGSGQAFWMVVPFIGGLLRRVVSDPLVQRMRWIPNDAQGAAHALLMVALATAAWALLVPHFPGLPADWLSWFNAACGATLGGVFASQRTTGAMGQMSGTFNTQGGRP